MLGYKRICRPASVSQSYANNGFRRCWSTVADALGVRQLKVFQVGKLRPSCVSFHTSRALQRSAFNLEPIENSSNPLPILYVVHGARNGPNKISRSLGKMSAAMSDREQVFSV